MVEALTALFTSSCSGDVEGFAGVLAGCYHVAYGHACSILGDFHLAEDAAQEAFIEVCRHLTEVRETNVFPG